MCLDFLDRLGNPVASPDHRMFMFFGEKYVKLEHELALHPCAGDVAHSNPRIERIPVSVMKGLIAWEWPGNIRELENFMERAVILTRGSSLAAPLAELRKVRLDPAPAAAAQPGQEDIARIVKETIDALKGKISLSDEFSQKEREEIERALTECKGRVSGPHGAAARLGINRNTLVSRMKKFGIAPRQSA